MQKRIVILSGGFDPIHTGHLKMIEGARELAGANGKVIVGVNSDEWLVRKKGYAFLKFEERVAILQSNKHVDRVLGFYDKDNTAVDLIEKIYFEREKDDVLIFANGGDRKVDKNIPEIEFCDSFGIYIVDGIGGHEKTNSSSNILAEYKNYIMNEENKEKRHWGYFKVLSIKDKYKVKELVLDPKGSISLQYHYHRNEHWTVVSGTAEVILDDEKKLYTPGSSIYIPATKVHKVTNVGKIPLVLIEIQTGEYFEEDDIIRLTA